MANQAGPADLTPRQAELLLMGIHPSRVQKVQGMAHLEAWDVRRTLTRIFGFGGWDVRTLELAPLTEQQVKNKRGDNAWYIVYRAQVRLEVRTTDGRPIAAFEDAAMGDAKNFPLGQYGEAHDFAMKSALSQALKRAAVNLGDQLGLSLYRKGDVNPVVAWSVPHMPEKETPPEDPGPGATEPEEDPEEVQVPAATQQQTAASVKWARQATSRLAGADLAAVAAVESEAAKRFRAGTLPPDAAQALRDAINARRAELGGADAAA